MSKILVTLLGTGKLAKGDTEKNEYIGTDYEIDGKIYKDKKFVSSAIIEHFKINKVFIIGTKDSMWDNIAEYFEADENLILELWDKKKEKEINEKFLKKLEDVINNHLGEKGSKCFIVKEGETESEILEIFDNFLDILFMIDKNDTVYFDITHLFRSVSVMSLVLAELLKIKSIKINGIFYGMLSKNPPSKIVNLKVLLEFLEWAEAIKELKHYGNSNSLRKLIEKSKVSDDIKYSFRGFSYALSMANMFALQNSIKILKGKIDNFKESNNKFIKLISQDLIEFINRLSKKSVSEFQFEFAKWNIENENYAIAYIALVEAVISALCEIEDLNPLSKDDRDYIKKEYLQVGKGKYKKSDTAKYKFLKTFQKVNNIRNVIAHQRSSSYSPKQSIENIKIDYDILYKYIRTLKSKKD